MIKACHLLDELKIGGLERTVLNIILYSDKKYDQRVWCLKQKGGFARQFEERGIVVREFGFRGPLLPTALFRLTKALKDEGFKIIICHSTFPAIWGGLAAFLAGIPLRLEYCHNIVPRVPWRTLIKIKVFNCFIKKVIAISGAVKRCLIEYVGINPAKIELIYNSVPRCASTLDPAARLDLRRTLGLKQDDFVVGNISRLDERKGQRYLIAAMASSDLQKTNCKCLIVGDGQELQNLESQVKSLNLEDRVIFTGSRLDIANLLSIMDVFVLPSIRQEGLGICLAEAASAGLPLIGTDIDGIPEIVEDGKNGFVVPPNDSAAIAKKIRYLMENPAETRRMGENSARIWRKRFSIEEMVKRIDGLYAQYL